MSDIIALILNLTEKKKEETEEETQKRMLKRLGLLHTLLELLLNKKELPKIEQLLISLAVKINNDKICPTLPTLIDLMIEILSFIPSSLASIEFGIDNRLTYEREVPEQYRNFNSQDLRELCLMLIKTIENLFKKLDQFVAFKAQILPLLQEKDPQNLIRSLSNLPLLKTIMSCSCNKHLLPSYFQEEEVDQYNVDPYDYKFEDSVRKKCIPCVIQDFKGASHACRNGIYRFSLDFKCPKVAWILYYIEVHTHDPVFRN
jgi:hypothetical protein